MLFSNEVLDGLDQTWDEQQSAPNGEMSEALRVCVARLAPRARQIISLRYHDKMSGDQVAARLKIRTDSVYVALGRIHRMLRDCMKRALETGVSRG